MGDWTPTYFERGYAQRWRLVAPDDVVRQETAGLSNLLRLTPAAHVIDIGCGHGRHAIALAERGSHVIGLDFSSALLARARQLAVELQAPVRWVRGDMRQLPFRTGTAAAAILLDAFGFFDTDEEHDAVLRETGRVLAPGSRLALKIVNGVAVLTGFRDQDREERDGSVISISRTLTLDPLRLSEKISIRGPRGNGEYERRQRLYRIEEMLAILDRAGFAVAGAYAHPDGMPFDPVTSPTMWVVAQRRSE